MSNVSKKMMVTSKIALILGLHRQVQKWLMTIQKRAEKLKRPLSSLTTGDRSNKLGNGLVLKSIAPYGCIAFLIRNWFEIGACAA